MKVITIHATYRLMRRKGNITGDENEGRPMVRFWHEDDDSRTEGFVNRCYGIPHSIWVEMGRPDFIDITVKHSRLELADAS